MTTYSSILTWIMLWTEETGSLQSIASQRIGHYWSDSTHANQMLSQKRREVHSAHMQTWVTKIYTQLLYFNFINKNLRKKFFFSCYVSMYIIEFGLPPQNLKYLLSDAFFKSLRIRALKLNLLQSYSKSKQCLLTLCQHVERPIDQ